MNDEQSIQRSTGESHQTGADATLKAAILARLGLRRELSGGETLAELLATLRTAPEAERRATAARRLGWLEERQGVVAALESTLQDKSAIVRAAAAYALGEVGKHAHVEPLLAALHDADGRVREAAAWALGELGKHIPVADLIAALQHDEDKGVRANCVRALGAYGEIVLEPPTGPLAAEVQQLLGTIIQALLLALRDPDWQVRELAALALGKFGNCAPTTALQAKVDDENEDEFVRKAAIRALGMQWEYISYSAPKGPGDPGTGGQLQFPASDKAVDSTPLQGQSGNVEFSKLVPADLEDITMVAQAIDNQWVPRGLLKMVMQGKITVATGAQYLESLARTEYIRALINSKRLVVNRAFLYNNPVIYKDYLPGHSGRPQFLELLRQGVIIPSLYNEQAPNDAPIFGTDPLGFPAWQQLCQEVRMQCIRYSWNEAEQVKLAEQQARRFHDFAMTAANGEPETYIQYVGLGLTTDASNALKKRLFQLARKCLEVAEKNKLATRNILYQEFVSADPDTAKRIYDPSKPFAGEIKQLLDLAYNSFQADAMNGYLLTPVDTTSRRALQEWLRKEKDKALTAEDIGKMLQRDAFSLVQEGLYLRSMGLLTLEDVLTIRMWPEWSAYIQSLELLLKEPMLFEHHAPVVYLNYIELMAQITRLLAQRNSLYGGALLSPWKPSGRLDIEVGGSQLSVLWTAEGVFKEWGTREIPYTQANGVADVNMRLVIGDWSGTRARSDLAASIDFPPRKMLDAVRQWEEIKKLVKSQLWMQEMSQRPAAVGAATLNDQ